MYAFEPREIEVASPKASDATKVHMKIVGVGVYPNEVVATAEYDALPFAYFTPAFLREHPKETQEYGFEVVRLKHGRADLPEFRKGLASRGAGARRRPGRHVLHRPHRGVLPGAAGDPAPGDRARRLRRRSSALAFVMIVVQVLARQIFLDARDYRTLATLGMTRRQRFATAMARVLVVSVAGGDPRGDRRGAGVAADADRPGAPGRAEPRVRGERARCSWRRSW